MDVPQACNILLIEDVPCHAELIELVISKRYHDTISVATTGLQGIELAQQAPPDLVFIRLMLMDMDGYEVCRRIKAIPSLRQVPVLLFAAIKPDMVYPEARRCGAAGYLSQPYLVDDLYAARDALLCGETYYPPL
ncbi:MAG: response regulator [Anaerolineae bacterium]|nr:response regulator [Anaerolineae bacterium]